MRYILLVTILSLLLAGCGDDEVQQAADEAVGSAVQQAGQDLVNFRCTIVGGQTFYFLEEKAMIKAPGRQSWLNDDGYFITMEANGREFLVQYPPTDSDMSFEAMMNAYTVSKTSDAYDCELNVVTEADVTLPDLEIKTPEELGEIMLEEMANYGK